MFQPVPPEQLPVVWEFVRHGLEVVLRRTCEPWNDVDVHRTLVSGSASLFVHPDGFVILGRKQEAWSCLPILHVWVAYFRPGKAKPHRAAFVAWLDERMRESRCVDIEFDSPRAGWAGLEPEFKAVRTVYRRKA